MTREELVGRWQESNGKRMFELREDGSAHTCFGDADAFPGTWHFSPPHQLLVRAVIPHNNPEIDDELNAHEMCYEIRQFTNNGFTAKEFDEEGLQTFSRL